jgi:hypothetical protein
MNLEDCLPEVMKRSSDHCKKAYTDLNINPEHDASKKSFLDNDEQEFADEQQAFLHGRRKKMEELKEKTT